MRTARRARREAKGNVRGLARVHGVPYGEALASVLGKPLTARQLKAKVKRENRIQARQDGLARS